MYFTSLCHPCINIVIGPYLKIINANKFATNDMNLDTLCCNMNGEDLISDVQRRLDFHCLNELLINNRYEDLQLIRHSHYVNNYLTSSNITNNKSNENRIVSGFNQQQVRLLCNKDDESPAEDSDNDMTNSENHNNMSLPLSTNNRGHKMTTIEEESEMSSNVGNSMGNRNQRCDANMEENEINSDIEMSNSQRGVGDSNTINNDKLEIED